MLFYLIRALTSISTGLLVAQSGFAYTFTSSDGAQFDGELISVSGETVTVQRDSDNIKFTVSKTRF
jgi:hypothetical protein